MLKIGMSYQRDIVLACFTQTVAKEAWQHFKETKRQPLWKQQTNYA